jgi:hypothetical protein
MPANTIKPEFSWERLRHRVADRLARNLPIDMRLPAGGRLRIDRQLPFLLVYRIPSQPDPGTADLVTTESAYLIAPGAREFAGEVDRLCRTILVTLEQQFGIGPPTSPSPTTTRWRSFQRSTSSSRLRTPASTKLCAGVSHRCRWEESQHV